MEIDFIGGKRWQNYMNIRGRNCLQRAEYPYPKEDKPKTKEEAKKIAEEIGKPVVIKAQAWVTGRAQAGGVKFAQNPGRSREDGRSDLGNGYQRIQGEGDSR